jgi:triosephosphate isomerase
VVTYIFTKVAGTWKFYGSFSSEPTLSKMLKHLADEHVEVKTFVVPNMDLDKIAEIEHSLALER